MARTTREKLQEMDVLRSQSAEVLGNMDFDGYAIGGLAVGDPDAQGEPHPDA